jgi:hypothetical protein
MPEEKRRSIDWLPECVRSKATVNTERANEVSASALWELATLALRCVPLLTAWRAMDSSG